MDYDYDLPYEVSVLCSACLCDLHSDAERQQHYTSEWHIYNVKRKTAELPPIPYQLFNEKFTLVQKMKEDEQKRSGKITCPITNREFKSQSAYDHFRSSKEYARQYERFVKKQQALQLAAHQPSSPATEQPQTRKFISKHHIDYVAPQPEDDQPTAHDLQLIEQDRLDDEEDAKEKAASMNDTTTTDTINSSDETMVDDEYQEQEGQVPIKLKYSLFDNVGPFTCTRTAYSYMLRKYSFKIPYMEFLIDIEGLLDYLGAKIGIGHVCLYCNKRFETTLGCQQHMLTQNHTSFSLEQFQKGAEDEGEDFIFNFWDFSHNFADNTYTPEEIQQRQMSRLRTLLVLGKKTIEDIRIQEACGTDVLSTVLTIPTQYDIKLDGLTDDGNIRLSDGSTILSRKNVREHEMKKTLAYYEKKNQAILEYKLANVSEYTKEKEEEVEGLKEFQKYWRQQQLRCGLRTNYILKKYFRKANQQNN